MTRNHASQSGPSSAQASGHATDAKATDAKAAATPRRRPLGTDIPFGNSVGVNVVSAQDGHAQMALILKPEHLNSAGAAHGGVILTMLDIAMAVAARSSAMDALGCATIDLNASFVRPSGGVAERLTSTAKVYDRSRTMRFCEATVESGDGRLIARGSGTFKVIRQPS